MIMLITPVCSHDILITLENRIQIFLVVNNKMQPWQGKPV